jgi:hypothetical protein
VNSCIPGRLSTDAFAERAVAEQAATAAAARARLVGAAGSAPLVSGQDT